MRVFLIILDGVGIGALPDAADYGDAGSHTLRHVAEAAGGLRVPTLERLGLGRIDALPGVRPVVDPRGSYGRMAERSKGKRTGASGSSGRALRSHCAYSAARVAKFSPGPRTSGFMATMRKPKPSSSRGSVVDPAMIPSNCTTIPRPEPLAPPQLTKAPPSAAAGSIVGCPAAS